jgi:hypothetical protein
MAEASTNRKSIWLIRIPQGFASNQIYDKALLRFGQGNIDFKW